MLSLLRRLKIFKGTHFIKQFGFLLILLQDVVQSHIKNKLSCDLLVNRQPLLRGHFCKHFALQFMVLPIILLAVCGTVVIALALRAFDKLFLHETPIAVFGFGLLQRGPGDGFTLDDLLMSSKLYFAEKSSIIVQNLFYFKLIVHIIEFLFYIGWFIILIEL
jgi:hypothetical protein